MNHNNNNTNNNHNHNNNFLGLWLNWNWSSDLFDESSWLASFIQAQSDLGTSQPKFVLRSIYWIKKHLKMMNNLKTDKKVMSEIIQPILFK